MKISRNNYKDYIEKSAPKTKQWKTLLSAFLVGGAICTIGQGVKNFVEYQWWMLTEEEVASIVSGIMIFFGAFFTGVGVYDFLGSFAGAGSMVPITGFANSVVSPALEFKSEGLVYGMSAKMFIISGPILVFGVVGSALVGLIYYFFIV